MSRSFPGVRARHAKRRQGFAAAILLFAAALIFGGMALSLDWAAVSYTHEQMRGGVTSAALAGTAELLDQSVLYPQLSLLPADERAELRAELLAQRVAAASAAAVEYAKHNPILGTPLEIEENEANAPGGDVVVGFVAEPTTLKSEFLVVEEAGVANSLLVRAQRNRARQNSIRLVFAPFIGAPTAQLLAAERATADHRVFGFQPIDGRPMPVARVCYFPNQLELSWFIGQPLPWPNIEDHDRVMFNPLVEEFQPGQDGIPELELAISFAPDGNGGFSFDGNCRWLLLPDRGAPEQLLKQVEEGLRTADLAPLGGRLALGPQNLLQLPLPPDQVREPLPLAEAFQSLAGERRIWPFGTESTDVDGNPLYEIQGFFAGRIVAVELAGLAVKILVQPCVMSTPHALTSPDRPTNPFIAKIMLNR